MPLMVPVTTLFGGAGMSVLNAASKKTTITKNDGIIWSMTTAHKPIKRFSMDGKIVSSTAFARMQQIYSEVLEEQMRDQGYVPRLDLMPEWTTKYNKSYYDFEISIYGTYVGRKKAKCLEGVESGKPVYFHESRPKESSLPQAAPSQEK